MHKKVLLMEIEIDLGKNLESNASAYFEKGKAAKQKVARILDSIKLTEKKLESLTKEKSMAESKVILKRRKPEWFEKFRWFYTSNGFLVLAGRDTQSNETVVKKHMLPEDLHFHAEITGAPHCVLKTENKVVDEESKKEAAIFAASFSRGWKESAASLDVYSVKPEQVSKKAPSGESLGAGAFMIYGQREWFKKTPLQIAIGIQEVNSEYRVISGPPSSVGKYAKYFVLISKGNKTPGILAKEIRQLFLKNLNIHADLDEIIKMLPPGESKISDRT